MYRRVLGLDIGTYGVKAVLSRGGLGRLEVRRFMRQQIEGQGEGDLPAVIRHAMAQFRQEDDLTGTEIICAFPGQLASFRRLHLPFTDPNKIKQTVPFEVETQVPYEIDELLLDYQVLEKDADGAQVLVGLTQRDALRDLLARLESAGVDPRILEFDATALSNVAGFLEEADGFVFIVDLGHSKTCLCGLRDGKLHSVRTIPLGGRALTEALQQDLGAENLEAERRKHSAGIDLLERGTPAFTRTLDRLAKEIDRTLNAPENTGGGRPDRLLLCGGTARLRGLPAYLEERVGLPCKLLALKEDERLSLAGRDGDALLVPQALGLSLRGALSAPVSRLNLRREEFGYKRDLDVVLQKFMPSMIITAALIVLLIAGVLVKTFKNHAAVTKIEAQIEQVFREANPNVTRVVDPIAQMRQSLGDMKRRTEALGLYAGNVTALDVLREISRRVPVSLDVTLKALSINENTIRVQGGARSFEVAEKLKTELDKIPFFSEVNVGDVRSERDGGKSFTL
ncbi:MAG: type II secretion system protein GspL, partial [Myxococcota bacterium]